MDKAGSILQTGYDVGLDIFNKVKDKVDQKRGTEIEKKVKEATSTDNWGASNSLKDEIARATYDYDGYSQVMSVLWSRMGESGKNWRIVFKSLELLEYLLKNASERVISESRDRIYQIRTLKDFNFIDVDGKDRGAGVREKSRQVVDLLNNNEQLQDERAKADKLRNKYKGFSGGSGGFDGGYGTGNRRGSGGGGGSSDRYDWNADKERERERERRQNNYTSPDIDEPAQKPVTDGATKKKKKKVKKKASAEVESSAPRAEDEDVDFEAEFQAAVTVESDEPEEKPEPKKKGTKKKNNGAKGGQSSSSVPTLEKPPKDINLMGDSPTSPVVEVEEAFSAFAEPPKSKPVANSSDDFLFSVAPKIATSPDLGFGAFTAPPSKPSSSPDDILFGIPTNSAHVKASVKPAHNQPVMDDLFGSTPAPIHSSAEPDLFGGFTAAPAAETVKVVKNLKGNPISVKSNLSEAPKPSAVPPKASNDIWDSGIVNLGDLSGTSTYSQVPKPNTSSGASLNSIGSSFNSTPVSMNQQYYGASGYGAPTSGYGAPTSGYGAPASGYGAPASGYGAPASGYGGYGYQAPVSTYGGYGTHPQAAPAAPMYSGYAYSNPMQSQAPSGSTPVDPFSSLNAFGTSRRN